jgi:hypothetical protein
MKSLQKYILASLFTIAVFLPVNEMWAGNKDRAGEAGASELLINPWARSSGWGGANTASVVDWKPCLAMLPVLLLLKVPN